MLIDVARPADIPELAALVNSGYRGEGSRAGWTTEADLFEGERTSAASLAADLAASPDRRMLALRETPGCPILGCVLLQTGYGADARACYLGMLTVSPLAQAKGLGRLLLSAAEEMARAWGASRMELRVLSPRAELMKWYERRGYRHTGETAPFPYDKAASERPTRMDLEFVWFRKDI